MYWQFKHQFAVNFTSTILFAFRAASMVWSEYGCQSTSDASPPRRSSNTPLNRQATSTDDDTINTDNTVAIPTARAFFDNCTVRAIRYNAAIPAIGTVAHHCPAGVVNRPAAKKNVNP